jgi:NAD+ synthase (glutamine-hydrolysing)
MKSARKLARLNSVSHRRLIATVTPHVIAVRRKPACVWMVDAPQGMRPTAIGNLDPGEVLIHGHIGSCRYGARRLFSGSEGMCPLGCWSIGDAGRHQKALTSVTQICSRRAFGIPSSMMHAVASPHDPVDQDFDIMRVALVQANPTVGDLVGNSRLIRDGVAHAQRLGADLVVFSELMISGYPPKDLLLREGFAAACDRAVARLATSLPGEIGVLIGHPSASGLTPGRVANACSLLADHAVQGTVHKLLLPNYDVFDERRYFRPADHIAPLVFRGLRLGVHICEDAWWGEADTFYHVDPPTMPDPVAQLAAAGVDCFINLSASPFEARKTLRRDALIQRHVARHQRPFLFVNQVGGNDDLVFDGHSMAWNSRGEKVLQLPGFTNAIEVIDLKELPAAVEQIPTSEPGELLDALILGLGDYMRKSGFTDSVLGLSGGIDSTLAAYIAAQATSPERVHGIMMPSRYSTGHSVDDAEALANRLGIDAQIVPIDEVHQAYERLAIVGPELRSQPAGLADQNLQARIRGAIVMIRSNHRGWIPLATGNKSELAMGYCTLYGDMAGGFAVLADLLKRDVYAICRYINEVRERREVIPQHVIEKAPSAELAPNQFDQDTLPPYPILDAILSGLIEDELSVATLCQTFPPETVRWIASRLDRNEYKRRQIPPGIKLSARAFGSGRRMPMAAKYDLGEG